jgi:Alginate export
MRSPMSGKPTRARAVIRALANVIAPARIAVLGCLLLLTVGRQARAQEEEKRSTGLPTKPRWTFNFDAGFGSFGFAHSLYTDVRPDPSGNLGDNWMESFVKPALSGTVGGGKGEFFGKISAVGERTFDAPPTLVGEDASSFKIEDLYVGWRSGTALGAGENALELTVGRAQYKIGHGFLLWDGGGEGGTRGGFWSNARKAWEFASTARFHAKRHTVEAFYLDRDEVPESESGTRAWGGNYELALGDATTLGATYMRFVADSAVRPDRDGLNVYNVRAYSAPLRRVPDLAFEAEYAREDNGDLLGSTAWNAQASYQLGKVTWKPRLSYRYAFFEGDDPGTTKNESFDALIPGFYDWGTWWQGEIAGEYFLANSNLISHQVRVHVTPSDAVSGGLIAYAFQLDNAPAGLTSKDIATELDAYADWKLNKNFIVSFVAAVAHPQDAVRQAFNRTEDFFYGMIYVAYSY